MKFKVQLVIVADDGEADATVEAALLEKQGERLEHLGMTLAESKVILKELQRHILAEQAAAFLATRAHCGDCGTPLRRKGHHTIPFRTLFGTAVLESPRLRTCPCRPREEASVSPLTELLAQRTAPELLFMETRWASLVSYGMSVKALKDFLPVGDTLNAATIRHHTLRVAKRCESELGEEQACFIEGCPRDWQALPPPEGPITVGIDGGYLRHWENKKTNFEVVVGKSVPTDRAAKCFGFVQTYDENPKRRLFELLSSQGLQMNQQLFCLSDGERGMRALQVNLTRRAEHILDWFHITMRLTVLRQFAKGLLHLDARLGGEIDHALERTKWYLWHGKARAALDAVDE